MVAGFDSFYAGADGFEKFGRVNVIEAHQWEFAWKAVRPTRAGGEVGILEVTIEQAVGRVLRGRIKISANDDGVGNWRGNGFQGLQNDAKLTPPCETICFVRAPTLAQPQACIGGRGTEVDVDNFDR